MAEQSGETSEQSDVSQTITCLHCRYEYRADAERCTICGYPWPWLKGNDHTVKKANDTPTS